jgi:hypothetical protein
MRASNDAQCGGASLGDALGRSAGTLPDSHPERDGYRAFWAEAYSAPVSCAPCLLDMLPSHRVGLPL